MTRATQAIYIKQFQDVLKNAGVLIQFLLYPGMTFMMVRIIDMPYVPASFHVSMFASMFVGMAMVSSMAAPIAEDGEKNSLRFLMMAGVKSHEYLIGVGGVYLTCALFTSIAFTILMPDLSIIENLLMLSSLMLGAVASTILGAIIGMISSNEQEASSMGSLAGLFLGFGPMITNLTGNEVMERIFRNVYTMNFVLENFRAADVLRNFGVIFANIMVLVTLFAWAYGKQEASKKGGLIMSKKAVAGLLITALIGGSGIGFAIWHNAGFIEADDARVATTMVPVISSAPGVLERFALYEGQRVRPNEILGWVEGGEAMYSPVYGLVVQTNALQNQFVSHFEPLALIADTNNLHIQADIEESDIASLRLGQPVRVRIEGFGSQDFTAHISRIGRVAHNELIPIEITLEDNINLDNIIGVSARARISLREPFTVMAASATNDASSNIISARGVVESAESRNVYSTFGQTISKVAVEVGDTVTAGQILAVLDTTELELAMDQQRAIIDAAEQTGQVAIADSQRMINEAAANLAQNANVHVISAQTAVNSAQMAYETARRNYDEAMRDYREGTNPQVQSAESFVRNARTELEQRQQDHTNIRSLYLGQVATQVEMRQAENAVTHARNQYNDARNSYNTAREFQQRQLEQLRSSVQSASTSLRNAQEMLRAARTSAQQDINRLRSHTASAEVSANHEHLEIALQQLERSMDDSIITAPISGTVTAVIAREGAVGMGLMFVIEDTNNLRIVTSFREYDLANIQTGTEVTITSHATGDAVYSGVISRISPAAIPNSPVVEFEAEVEVVSVDTDLRIGMNTRIDVIEK